MVAEGHRGKVAISGASGLVGTALTEALGRERVVPLVRDRARAEAKGGIFYDPAAGLVDGAGLEGTAALVHLAAENLAERRWSEAQKKRIWSSRVDGTRLLAEALGTLAEPPPVFLCASAIGVYGDAGDAWVDESTPVGEGFLADLCRAWEAAAASALEHGVRVVYLRFGIIMSGEGGALGKMLPVFRAGLGGRLGKGDQYMSWVHLDDAVRAVRLALEDESISGPLNIVAPEPVTNREFSESLGRVLHRPAVFPVPAFALKMAVGAGLAEQALLAGQRVRPARLTQANFTFQHPSLEPALAHLL